MIVCFQLLDLVVHFPQGFLRCLELGHAFCKVSFCLTEELPLWLHCLGHEVVLVHGAHPQAQRFTGDRGLLDRCRVEVFALHVRRDGLDDFVRDIVLVEVEESVQQRLGVLQDLLLAGLPKVVNLFARRIRVILFHRLQLEHDTHRLTCKAHTRRRIRKHLDLADVIRFQLLQAGDGGVQGGQCFVQVLLGVVLDGLSGLRLSFGLSFFFGNLGRYFLCCSFVNFNHLHHLFHFLLRLLQDRFFLHQGLLQATHLRFRVTNLLQAHLVALLLRAHLLSLRRKYIDEAVEELQI
mmetsp:Transcript_22097/g.52483  ORF Transcript_22097/g.52483 Transcript_22097/m.52483 type:complete len:293 (+) Transcript_22097:3606-4484(+)